MKVGVPKEIKTLVKSGSTAIAYETVTSRDGSLPFIKDLANLGWRNALRRDLHLANGLNVHAGDVNFEAVAEELGYTYQPAEEVLAT